MSSPMPLRGRVTHAKNGDEVERPEADDRLGGQPPVRKSPSGEKSEARAISGSTLARLPPRTIRCQPLADEFHGRSNGSQERARRARSAQDAIKGVKRRWRPKTTISRRNRPTQSGAPNRELEIKVKQNPHDPDAKADLGSDQSMDASDPSAATQPSSQEPVPSSTFPEEKTGA